MRPLRKGAARTGLAEGLAKLAQVKIESFANAVPPVQGPASVGIGALQAAVLGGAIEEALRDLFPVATLQHGTSLECPEVQLGKWKYCRGHKQDTAQAESIATFWRLTNENLWRLTRALEASRLLDKAGE